MVKNKNAKRRGFFLGFGMSDISLMIIAVILIGSVYAQDAPSSGDRGGRSARLDRPHDVGDGYVLADQGLAAESMSHCHEDEGRQYLISWDQSIQDAVNHARTGDVIVLRKKTYNENVIIDSQHTKASCLTLKGENEDGTVVDGGNNRRVITIKDDKKVTLKDMTIQNGNAGNDPYQPPCSGCNNTFGGGILNDGKKLTIQNCIIKHNMADTGSGIFNDNGGTLKLISGTICDNKALVGGGGIGNWGTLIMDGGIISGNHEGGIYSGNMFILNDGAIAGNKADKGGGVFNSGTMIMNDGTISGNTADTVGGGIFNYAYLFTMKGGTISGNTAGLGGGILNMGTVNLWGGSISLNNATATFSTPKGGGIFNIGDGKINDVHDNTPDQIAYSP